MSTDQPQPQFDDLYTAVYALIDDAKIRHRVVKLYKGSHGSSDPHPVVLDYGQFFAAHRRVSSASLATASGQAPITTG